MQEMQVFFHPNNRIPSLHMGLYLRTKFQFSRTLTSFRQLKMKLEHVYPWYWQTAILNFKSYFSNFKSNISPSNSSGNLQRTATNTAFLVRFPVMRFPDGPNIRIQDPILILSCFLSILVDNIRWTKAPHN